MAKGKYEFWVSEEGLILLEGWAREGLTNDEIIEKIKKRTGKINRSTFYDWLKKYPDISNALKKGKEIVDYKVEKTLFERALGYDYTEKVKELKLNPKTGEEELTVVKEIVKHMPPDTLALFFWLKNRKPDKWRDKPKDDTVDNTVKVVFEGEAKDFAE